MDNEDTNGRLGSGASFAPKKILVVDDDVLVLETVTLMLEAHGYEVVCADGGNAALEIFRERKGDVDVVILDLSMPQMNGIEVLNRLRKIDKKVRVLLLSGYALEDFDKNLAEASQDFLSKPYMGTGLVDKVKKILGD